MVQKPADIFHCFSSISAQLGGCMPEDVDARRSNSGLFEVSLEVAIERPAGDSFTRVR